MICSGCGRAAAASGEVCSGCRTISRIKFLWTHQLGSPEDSSGLSILRGCAGELTDLAESRSGRLFQEQAERESAARGGKGAPVAAPEEKPEEVETALLRKERGQLGRRSLLHLLFLWLRSRRRFLRTLTATAITTRARRKK